MSDNVRPSKPIPIASARGRARSVSVSSTSSGSASSTSDLPTPPSSATGQRISIPSPSTSPILSYFLAQSPAKPPSATFPLRRAFGTAPVFEVDEETEREIPVATHTRRASVNVANRFSGQNQTSPMLEERGSGLLRRLSLSSGPFAKLDNYGAPNAPPNSAVSPTSGGAPFVNKPRRSATISSGSPKPRRAPSPMGERILKGHFDGFN